MKNNNYIRYDKALTDNEILFFSQIIIQFKNKEIDFTSLRDIFLNYGIIVEAVTYDFSKRKMTINEINSINKRILEKNYSYDDINYFILNSSEFKNVIFCIDYKAIEVLANYGILEYQEKLISILMTELKYSSNTNEELKVERNKWKRRISELKSQLSKNESFDKSK